MFQQILQTQLSLPINLPIVRENPKATESNTSKDTNKYITDDNELFETPSKKQKPLSSLLRKLEIQTRQFLIMVRNSAIQLFPTT